MRTLDNVLDSARSEVSRLFSSSVASRPLWPAPYDEITPEAAYRWLTECWWTFNEADGGAVEKIPAIGFVERYSREWVECYLARVPKVDEKSRRLMVSWMARGLECWVLGFRRGDWLIVDQTFPSAAEHVWRIDFALNELYDRRPELRLRPHKVRGAIEAKRPDMVILPNGSTFVPGHQEAGATQGKGKTGITLEELSKYTYPAAFWDQSLILTMGKAQGAGELTDSLQTTPGGGWLCAIANASMNPEWHLIKQTGVGPDNRPVHAKAVEILKKPDLLIDQGYAAMTLPNGVRYNVIHYTADETKRAAAWAVEASRMTVGGITGRNWRREMELHEEGYEGKPVYETYRDDWHSPLRYREKERIPVIPGSWLILGLDCGSTMRPGAILLQVTPFPFQVHALLEVTSTGNEPMSLFAPRVWAAVKARVGGRYPDVHIVGDGTITNRQGNNGDSAAMVGKKTFGRLPQAMSNLEQVRQSAVTDLLVLDVSANDPVTNEPVTRPFFAIDAGACPMLRDGFLGLYRFGVFTDSEGQKRFKPHPEKNEYSEPHDALQYASLKAWALLKALGANHVRRPKR